MALDSRQKRESAFGISLPFLRVLPLPDGSDADSTDERAHLAMNCNSISALAAGGMFIKMVGPGGGLVGSGGMVDGGGGLAA